MANNEKQIEAIYDVKQLGTSKTLILGLQHLFAMFGATVLVPAITGLNVSTTLLFAGLGTLLFHLLTGRKVPAFLGSSFAFLGGYAAIAPTADAAGAALDKSRSTKSEVIAYLLEAVGSLDSALMVGDTAYDVLGSAAHGIPCAGVSWGYGKVEEMAQANAACIAHTVDALYAFVRGAE